MQKGSEERTEEQPVPEAALRGFWARVQKLAEWMEEQDSATN